MAIKSFADKQTEDLFVLGKVKKGLGWASIKKIVTRKLDMLDFALTLSDLKSPPGNKLETLRGDLKGFYSIRINNQWRIVFHWSSSGPENVEIADYH